MTEGRLPKIALKWMPKQKRARGRPKKNWMDGVRKVMKKRNLNEGQWEDRKQWSLGVGQQRTTFWNRHIYTGCPRRNVRDFRRVFLMLNYTDITQNTYVQSRAVTEIMAREKCGRHKCRNTVRPPWRHTSPMHLPNQRDMVMHWPWCLRYSTVALTSQDNR